MSADDRGVSQYDYDRPSGRPSRRRALVFSLLVVAAFLVWGFWYLAATFTICIMGPCEPPEPTERERFLMHVAGPGLVLVAALVAGRLARLTWLQSLGFLLLTGTPIGAVAYIASPFVLWVPFVWTALFVGLAPWWSQAFRPDALDRSFPHWPSTRQQDIVVALLLAVISAFAGLHAVELEGELIQRLPDEEARTSARATTAALSSPTPTVDIRQLTPDAIGVMHVGGSPITLAQPTRGLTSMWTFTAQAGNEIELVITAGAQNPSYAVIQRQGGFTRVALVAPNGDMLIALESELASLSGVLSRRVSLPASGEYRLILHEGGSGLYPMTIELRAPPS